MNVSYSTAAAAAVGLGRVKPRVTCGVAAAEGRAGFFYIMHESRRFPPLRRPEREPWREYLPK